MGGGPFFHSSAEILHLAGDEAEAREAACVFHVAAQDAIRRFIAVRHPDEADRLADFVSTTMAGLSASARHGHSLERLEATARLAGMALMQEV